MAEPLGVLVGLLREAREAETVEALGFVMVNAPRRLFPYDRAVLLRPKSGGGWRVAVASGASQVDRGAPLIQWLERTAAAPEFAAQARTLREMTATADERNEIGLRRPLWVPLIVSGGEQGGEMIGALWLDRADPWREAEAALLGELADACAHALRNLERRRRGGGWRRGWRRGWYIVAAAVLAALMLLLQRGALAPAQMVARDASAAEAPLDGVIGSFEVKPNQWVNVGDVLFTLDDTDRRARLEVAAKALDVARVEHRQASQGALGGKRDASKLAALEAQISMKEIELDNARQQLERTRARASRSGVALLPDVQEYVGRPVATGERVMLVADPADVEARAFLAAHDALPVNDGAAVRIFLDADPLNPLNGRVIRIHHEAEETPVGMAFRVMIALDPAAADAPRIGARGAPRIGARGAARIDGDRAPLFLYLFRRPIAALRQALGI